MNKHNILDAGFRPNGALVKHDKETFFIPCTMLAGLPHNLDALIKWYKKHDIILPSDHDLRMHGLTEDQLILRNLELGF